MASHKSNKFKGVLPCGNPKRYDCSDVIKSTHKRKAQENGADTETESEKHIKSMVKNQIKTDTTLEEQFSHHRDFASASAYDPTADKLIGLHLFEQHKHINNFDSRVEYFRQCGLTEEEIKFLFQREQIAVASGSKRYGFDPAMEQKWFDEIMKKIDQKEDDLNKPDRFKGGLELSRQSLDLEKSMMQHQKKNPILPSGIVTQKKDLSVHPQDPINHIPEIMKDIQPKPEREPRRDRRRRRKLHRQMQRQQLYSQDEIIDSHLKDGYEELNRLQSSFSCENQEKAIPKFCSDIIYPNQDSLDSVKDSTYDKVTGHNNLLQDSSKLKERLKTDAVCMESHSKMLLLNEPKEINSKIDFLSEEEIIANRIGLQEILSCEKFSNYQPGKPNKVVYVKNLPKSATVEDLFALFGRYQRNGESKIVFKLLSGRMRGQAFITFPDSSTAGQAINLLNGYKLKNTPIILSYGKKEDETS